MERFEHNLPFWYAFAFAVAAGVIAIDQYVDAADLEVRLSQSRTQVAGLKELVRDCRPQTNTVLTDHDHGPAWRADKPAWREEVEVGVTQFPLGWGCAKAEDGRWSCVKAIKP